MFRAEPEYLGDVFTAAGVVLRKGFCVLRELEFFSDLKI